MTDSFVPSCYQKVSYQDSIATLAEALLAFPNDESVQSAAFMALCSRVQSSGDRQDAAKAGIIEAVTMALTTHVRAISVTPWVCRAVFAIAYNEDALQLHFGETGVIGGIVAAMSAHPTHADLQVRKCQNYGAASGSWH
jgi:hypothetical protein